MRHIAYSVVLASAFLCSAAFAQDSSATAPASSSAPAQTGYSTSSTPIGTLLADPAAKAVLLKYIPTIVNNPQIQQASTMTLKNVQQYAADQLTDPVLAEIDADLAKLPVSK